MLSVSFNRLLDDGTFADLTLSINSVRIPVHCQLLRARLNGFFSSMVEPRMTGDKDGEEMVADLSTLGFSTVDLKNLLRWYIWHLNYHVLYPYLSQTIQNPTADFCGFWWTASPDRDTLHGAGHPNSNSWAVWLLHRVGFWWIQEGSWPKYKGMVQHLIVK